MVVKFLALGSNENKKMKKFYRKTSIILLLVLTACQGELYGDIRSDASHSIVNKYKEKFPIGTWENDLRNEILNIYPVKTPLQIFTHEMEKNRVPCVSVSENAVLCNVILFIYKNEYTDKGEYIGVQVITIKVRHNLEVIEDVEIFSAGYETN